MIMAIMVQQEGLKQYISLSTSNTQSAVADWNAIRGTSYIYPNTPMSSAQAAALKRRVLK